MNSYNKRLDGILDQLMSKTADASYGEWQVVGLPEAKQDITSLIKELVAEAKPKEMDSFYEKPIVDEFEQNLLKALEER